jgi:23S rRNA pseudouridine1911/1915/1917 synthase
MTTAAEVLYEDNHLLALYKPAGCLSMGDDTGDESMVDVARDYLRVTYGKPGNIFVGVVHRLDRPVSGVLLFAKTSKAASRLSDQFRRGTVRKTYRAVVESSDSSTMQRDVELTDWLLKNRDTNVVSVVSLQTPGAQKCVLKYRTARVQTDQHSGSRSQRGRLHLDVEPVTGRSHQIRVQLAHAGLPIVGDTKYGSRQRTGGRILLHAACLEIDHPTLKDRLSIIAAIPQNFD